MDYSEVTTDQRIAILKGRIAGWETDHFGHEINLAAGQAANDPTTIEQSQTAMTILEASIAAGKKMLDDLTAQQSQPAATTTDPNAGTVSTTSPTV